MSARRSMLFAVAWALAIAPLAATGGSGGDDAGPAPARQRELLRLLKQDCGACHGLRLTGGLGPALTPDALRDGPALTPDALRDKPASSLASTIVQGRAGTAMPPWRGFVSDDEAEWLVARLREGTAHAP